MKLHFILLIFISIGLLLQPALGQTEKQRSPSEDDPKVVELTKRAVGFEDQGLFGKAIETYSEILNIQPNDLAAMNTIAGLYGKLEDPVSEQLWAQKALAKNPQFFPALINLGNGLAMQGKFSEALKAYRDAEKLKPHDPLPVYSQGVVFENQNKFRDALAFYERSIDLDPGFEDGLFGAAAMNANLKQFGKAKALLNRLLRLNPNAEDARQMLQQIEREKP